MLFSEKTINKILANVSLNDLSYLLETKTITEINFIFIKKKVKFHYGIIIKCNNMNIIIDYGNKTNKILVINYGIRISKYYLSGKEIFNTIICNSLYEKLMRQPCVKLLLNREYLNKHDLSKKYMVYKEDA